MSRAEMDAKFAQLFGQKPDKGLANVGVDPAEVYLDCEFDDCEIEISGINRQFERCKFRRTKLRESPESSRQNGSECIGKIRRVTGILKIFRTLVSLIAILIGNIPMA